MATMMGNLYEALVAAGVDRGKAQAAAEEAYTGDRTYAADVADLKADMRLVKWMLGALLALNVAMFVNQLFH
jgi:tetrahydromethanopterin S-methyltransferase subunit D